MSICVYSGWVQNNNDKRNVKRKLHTVIEHMCIAVKFKNSNSIALNSKTVIVLKKEKYNRIQIVIIVIVIEKYDRKIKKQIDISL